MTLGNRRWQSRRWLLSGCRLHTTTVSRRSTPVLIVGKGIREICGRLFAVAVDKIFQLREVQGLIVYASDEIAPTENRLEGLLVPVPDDIHTSVDNRTPEIFRARSTGPILSPG